ncbi:F-box protein CPR1-like [Papaver somniferum]|uniref:F-box protein CPR1-like n=1 Tax=Papaver somniferum TaxID=3469 RepID=UPI000E70106E|nr:F-box protein CPR1-like [Papaver somniferum]
MSALPKELYHDIVLRLPVKSLLECRYAARGFFFYGSVREFSFSYCLLITDLRLVLIFQLPLDTRNEKFVELQLPKEPLKNNHSLRNVWVLEGCLSAVNAIGVHSEVWVMQTYGVGESWTKRFVITHSRIIKEMYYLRLMWDFKNGEILLMSGSNLVLLDAISGKPKRLRKMLKGIENYVESLVSL